MKNWAKRQFLCLLASFALFFIYDGIIYHFDSTISQRENLAFGGAFVQAMFAMFSAMYEGGKDNSL